MSRRWDWGFISRSQCSGVEGVEGVEEVEGVEGVEVVEEVEGVEDIFSSEKTLPAAVFSTPSLTLFRFSCML